MKSKTEKKIKYCEDWKVIKSLDKSLGVRNKKEKFKCPYCEKIHQK